MDTWEESFNTTFGGPHLLTYHKMREDFENNLKKIERKHKGVVKNINKMVSSDYDEQTGQCSLQLRDKNLPPQVVAEIKKAYRNSFEGE